MSSMAKPMEEIVPNPDAVAPPIEEIKDSETLLKEFFKDVSNAKRDAEVERVLSSFKLNPYEFLKLHFDCEMKEIPRAYRKLSLLVHPDKCKHKDAKAAFDALGQAQKLLLDEDFKRALDFNLQQARDSVLKNWKKRHVKMLYYESSIKVIRKVCLKIFARRMSFTRGGSTRGAQLYC